MLQQCVLRHILGSGAVVHHRPCRSHQLRAQLAGKDFELAVGLRHIEGYDNARIASLLGTSEGAVRTAVSRARRRVAEAFGIVQGSRINPDY